MLDHANKVHAGEDDDELRRQNRSIVEQYMRARGDARLERHTLFTEDGVGGLDQRHRAPIVIRGRNRLAEHGVWSLRCFPDWVWTEVQIFDTQDPNRFWVECRGFIHSFHFENGRIKEQREFMNPCEQFRALGIAVPVIRREGIPT